ncbi:MAG: hypothetical protein JXA14_27375 [Anaerolineae bacterium]|nr:hypothetical protein [Anaerolineae bacterium]
MSDPILDDLIRQYFTVADDGHVISRDGEATIVRREDGDYEVRIDERCLTVTAADLLRVWAKRQVIITDGSQVGIIGDYAHVEGGIHQHKHYHYAAPLPTPDGRRDFYRHIDLPPHYIPRPEVLEAIRTALLSGAGSVALTSAVKIALHGMGGIGKTVLARALCDDQAVQDHFSDGILWATLGQTPDLGARLREWVEALGGIISETAPTLPQLKTWLGDLLRDRACLLVVDDAWQYTHVEHFQAGGTRCCLLCTTRDAEVAHALGATVQPVDVLPPEQAQALLAEWAGGALDETSPGLLKQIIKHLGGLPLALKLAGAQLRSKDPARWLETFDVGKLKARRTKTLHDNLALTLALSLDDLNAESRQCYTALAIFKEDEAIPFPALVKLWGALAGLDEDAAADLLDDLAARALLQRDENRAATLHDLLRDLIAAELGQDGTLAAHRALLDAYRQTIPAASPNGTRSISELSNSQLSTSNWSTAPDDGYLYAHLAYHLDAVDDESELHALFADDAWLHARVPADDYRYDGYLADLALDWRHTYEQILAQCTAGEPPRAIAKGIHYTLVQTTVNALATNYEPELVARAVETGLWSPERGVSVLQWIMGAKKQAKMAAALLATRRLAEGQCMVAQHLGLAAAREIEDERRRAHVLSALVPHLEGEARQQALAEGLAAARTIANEDERASVLATLAPHIEDELPAEGLTAARKVEGERRRAYILAALASRLEGGLLVEGLAAACKIEDKEHRASVLAVLAPHLEGELLAQGLAAVRATVDEWYRADVLLALAPHLEGEARQQALTEALAAARKIEWEWYRADVLTALASHLEGEARQQALTEAMAAARGIEDKRRRVDALTALAPHLEGKLLAEGLAAAREIEDEEHRAHALTALASHLEGEGLAEGLAEARKIKDEWYRAEVLTALASHLEGEVRQQALTEALAAARAIKYESRRAKVLTALAPHLEGEARQQALTEAMAAARGIEDEEHRAHALTALASHLEGDLLTEGLAAACEIWNENCRADVLVALAPHLEGDWLSERLADARKIGDEWRWADVLAALAPHLEGEARQQALAKGLAAAHKIGNKSEQAKALVALAPHLESEIRQQALAKGLATVWGRLVPGLATVWGRSVPGPATICAMRDRLERVLALAVLASHLEGEIRQQALAKGLAITRLMGCGWEQMYALKALAPHLEGSLLAEGLAAARALSDEGSWVQILVALAPHLEGDLLAEGLVAAREIKDVRRRVEALAALAPRLEGDLLAEGLAAARAIDDDRWRADVLATLAPHLEGDLLNETRIELVQHLRSFQHHERKDLLNLLSRDDAAFLCAFDLTADDYARIAQSIIDVCTKWEWL